MIVQGVGVRKRVERYYWTRIKIQGALVMLAIASIHLPQEHLVPLFSHFLIRRHVKTPFLFKIYIFVVSMPEVEKVERWFHQSESSTSYFLNTLPALTMFKDNSYPEFQGKQKYFTESNKIIHWRIRTTHNEVCRMISMEKCNN